MTALFARIRSAVEAQMVGEAGFDGVAGDQPIGPPGQGKMVRLKPGIALLPDGEKGAPSDGGAARNSVPGPGGLQGTSEGGWLVRVLDDVASDAILAVTDEWHELRTGGADGILLDPAGRLLDQPGVAALAAVRAHCRAQGLVCGLAGLIEPPDLPRLLALEPDVVVVGGVVRRGGTMEGDLDPAALRLVRALAPALSKPGGPPLPQDKAPSPDRVFLRDLVLPIAIGAYRSERGRTQRVRFSVEADIRAAGRTARDMSDVVSYDLFSDAIHRLTRDRHIDFVETLAEEIATAVLVDPRVLRVRVTVEKLDVGPGSVGIAIERGGPS